MSNVISPMAWSCPATWRAASPRIRQLTEADVVRVDVPRPEDADALAADLIATGSDAASGRCDPSLRLG